LTSEAFELAVWHTLLGISGAFVYKNNQSESDTVDKLIRPAIVRAGWNTLEQIYAQYPLRAGRVVVRGKTAKRDKATVLFADFVLCLKPNIPLAVVDGSGGQLHFRCIEKLLQVII
jgi:type I site-specific restriction endonuclease